MMRQPQHVTMCVPCWMTRWFYDVVVCVCAWPCASSDSVRVVVVALVLHHVPGDSGWTFLLSSVSERRARPSVFACEDVGPSRFLIFY